jgi:hypothetical protein
MCIQSQNEVEADIKGKIAAGNRCYRSFGKILGTRYISKNTKIRIYKTIIRPIVLYGSETWAITGKMASSLVTWERKILRKIYGPKCEQGVWRIRTNLELQNVYRSPDIVTEIKVRRLKWLGHIIRMDGARMAKKVFVSSPEGRRDIGRPKLRWLDDVEDDIKAVGIRRWRIKEQDRSEWTAIKTEAKVKLKGP